MVFRIVPKEIHVGGVISYHDLRNDALLAVWRPVVLPVPSFENVAFASPDLVGARDGNFHIHEKRIRGVKPDRIVAAERVVFDVAVPHDEGFHHGGGFKVRPQAENVGGAVRGDLLALGSGEIQSERTAGVREGTVHISALLSTPSLYDPIGENAVGRVGHGTRHRHHIGFVKV